MNQVRLTRIPVMKTGMLIRRPVAIEWPGQNGSTAVEWLFSPREDGTTFVDITNSGFTGDGDQLVAQATDSMQGSRSCLAGLKALLEHSVQLNLVPDRYPEGVAHS